MYFQGKDFSLCLVAEQARFELLKELDDDDDNFSGGTDIEVLKYINIHVDKTADPLVENQLKIFSKAGETGSNIHQYSSVFQPAVLHRNVAFPLRKANYLRIGRKPAKLNKK
jgi:hypothetical protein